MKKYCIEIILAIILLALSLISIFVGVIDIDIKDLLTNDNNALMIFVVSRLPRLLAIICTGMGMSVAGLIMQQLCMNKFVSPTTGATISSAQLGILLALLFIPNSTLWQRAGFAFVTAILGTWVFVWFIQKVQYKDVVMVPLVGIMFGNVIGGITNFLAYKYEMTQALSTWLVGHFSLVLKGRYEIVYMVVPLIILAFVFANHFNIVGMGKDFSKNLGVPYDIVLFGGLTIAAMITASAQIDVIPEDVAVKLLCQSSFVEDIQRESILRFNESIQKNAIMYREQVEKVLPEVISKKQSYTLSDIINCCLAINQRTPDNISQIAVM